MISLEEKRTERTFTLTLDERSLEFLHAIAGYTAGCPEMYDLYRTCRELDVKRAEIGVVVHDGEPTIARVS